MKMLKVHLWDDRNEGPACGSGGNFNTTKDIHEITCLRCKDMLKKFEGRR